MATAASPILRWRNDRLFYTFMGVAIALATFWGFARSYYLNHWFETPAGMRKLEPLLHVHGAIFTAWIVLNVIQPVLIARRNPRLHRKLGYAGAVIAVLMVVVGNVTAVAAMHGGFIGLGDPFVFYAVPFFAINVFALIVALAVHWRNRAETHKRLILLASTQIVEAAVARVPVAAVAVGAPFSFMVGADLIIVAGTAYDLLSRGKVHKVWLWGGSLVVVSQVLRLAISQTAAWHGFAEAMAALWPGWSG